jgi:hypothetical protein
MPWMLREELRSAGVWRKRTTGQKKKVRGTLRRSCVQLVPRWTWMWQHPSSTLRAILAVAGESSSSTPAVAVDWLVRTGRQDTA